MKNTTCDCNSFDCAACFPDLQHHVDVNCGCGSVRACYAASCEFCGADTCDNCERCERCQDHIDSMTEDHPDRAKDYAFRAGWVAAMVWLDELKKGAE